jgi:DNA-binding response OmpR family regulator
MRLMLIGNIPWTVERAIREDGFAADNVSDEGAADTGLRAGTYGIALYSPSSLARGLELLKKWRSDETKAHIIVLTDQAHAHEKVDALNSGADDYLTKPVDLSELLARVRAVARRELRMHAPIIRVHDLEIHKEGRTVRRGGRNIHLTPREFDLLHFLASHRGTVVTRSMICQKLYDGEYCVGSNVVDVYIRYLRSKIDEGFDPPLIGTRWGYGYFLRDETDQNVRRRARRAPARQAPVRQASRDRTGKKA